MFSDGLHVIAEAGTNHNGSPDEALRLVDLAARCGADSVKFQIINPEGLYLPGVYDYGTYDIREVVALRRRHQLPDATYAALAARARERGIALSASVFDERGLDLLCSLAPPYVKIASTDLNNLHFLRQVAARGLPVLLSTGMSSLTEIERSVEELRRAGQRELALMHCVSVYPAALAQTNLGFIDVLRERFDLPVGFSDHTRDSIAACIAIAKGATVVEKHFTRDTSQEGFDHRHALVEAELAAFVADLRSAAVATRPGAEKVGEAERLTRRRARRSLYAARALRAGERIRIEDVLIVRPENVMGADEIDLLVGRRLRRDIAQHAAFTPGHLAL
jgi:N,N'-diacetyllegionaminate synthase